VVTISGGSKIAAYLNGIASKAQGLPTVSVGFLKGATYPNGISVPMIAATNEFGVPSNNQPPRPFFRRMIADKKSTWGKAVALQLKATNYDVPKTLERMGQGIKGQLQTSIRDLIDPPLSPVTIARKGFSKPLIESGTMLNAVDYRVDNAP
jgi:hypothetical protein